MNLIAAVWVGLLARELFDLSRDMAYHPDVCNTHLHWFCLCFVSLYLGFWLAVLA